ncbi:MAG TPA: Rieske 2Fe-2S domain-containing protein [Verrucomicrobiae bacterium]|nr:Rieske 2Fe-2S domain-containing protein [Verrucomicrobiae bacterium]
MTESENHLLTRVGPGTPMGNLLRQYWIPLLPSSELPEKDGAPLRVRLLGENLIAFRNTDGKVGLLDHVCPHRCASLFFGRNEENGLRCLYHGWKFDIDGRCVDVPNEPAGSNFHEQIRATAYPCVEKNGLVWTYMGPARGNPPPLPELGWAMVGPNRRGALRYQRDCNWLQAMEGDFDSSHLSFLHLTFDAKKQGTTEAKPSIEYYRNLARMDKQPLLEVRETDAGVMYGARRAAEAGQFYWRVTQFLMPFYTSVPSYGGKNRDKVWVPIDDEHTMVWEPHWSSTRDLTEEEQKGWKGRVAPSGFLPNNGDWLGRARFAANVANDYLHSRARQQTSNFSGFEDVTPIQDAAMQESMGSICDRTREHLGASDAAIVQMRRRLLGAVNALNKDKKLPPEIAQPECYRKHGDQMLLNESDSWVEHYAGKMKADYAGL